MRLFFLWIVSLFSFFVSIGQINSDSLIVDTIPKKKIRYGLFGGIGYDLLTIRNLSYFSSPSNTVYTYNGTNLVPATNPDAIKSITTFVTPSLNFGFYREKEISKKIYLLTMLRVQSFNSGIYYQYNNGKIDRFYLCDAMISMPVLLDYKCFRKQDFAMNFLVGIEPRYSYDRWINSPFDLGFYFAFGPEYPWKKLDFRPLFFYSFSPFANKVPGNDYDGYSNFKLFYQSFGLSLLL